LASHPITVTGDRTDHGQDFAGFAQYDAASD